LKSDNLLENTVWKIFVQDKKNNNNDKS